MTFFLILIFVLFFITNAINKKRFKKLDERLIKQKNAINGNARSSNEHLRALQEFASILGYCIHEERDMTFKFGSSEEPVVEKKLVVHKKVAVKPAKKAKK